MTAARRPRIDALLIARGLCESRSRAQALVIAGRVWVDDRRVEKPGTRVAEDAVVEIRGSNNPFVSRGGLKLRGALDRFAQQGLDVRGRIAMDVGASTGGFTDCLLQADVARVHAVDVGYGQLAWKLVTDTRVIVHDRTNIRQLAAETIGESIDLVVADCSFISLVKVLPHLSPFLATCADLVVLVKPQFELEPGRVGKGGVVKNAADRAEAVRRVSLQAGELGFVVRGEVESPLAGRDGNREVFLWLHWGPHL